VKTKAAMIIVPVMLLACALPSAAAKSQKVTITSTPAGAMVFIDSKYEGTTPLTKELPEGACRLKLVRKGYADWTSSITIPLAKPEVDVALKAAKRGSIKVTSVPDKCTVYVDGRESGLTPLMINDLPDGVYDVRVEKTNYMNSTQTVEIADGKDAEVRVELKSRMEEVCMGKLKENPDDLNMYTELGHYYLLEGKYDDAREIFKKGVEVSAKPTAANGDVMRFYQELGKVFTGQFKFTDKIETFLVSFRDVIEYAIEHGPRKNTHCERLISLYAAMGHGEDVMKLADKINANDPQRGIYKEIGSIYLERGMTPAAIKMLSKAVMIKDDFGARLALGSAFHRSHRFNEAVEQYALADKLNPTPEQKAELLNYQARLYQQKGDYDKALECIDAALKTGKGGQQWLMLKVNILLDAGKCDDARQLINDQMRAAETTRDKKNTEELLRIINKRCKPRAEQK